MDADLFFICENPRNLRMKSGIFRGFSRFSRKTLNLQGF